MSEKFLTDNQVAERYGIARPTVWRWQRENPDFPRAVYLAKACTRWRLSDIEAWEEAQADARAARSKPNASMALTPN